MLCAWTSAIGAGRVKRAVRECRLHSADATSPGRPAAATADKRTRIAPDGGSARGDRGRYPVHDLAAVDDEARMLDASVVRQVGHIGAREGHQIGAQAAAQDAAGVQPKRL